ncbi:hypothetical protein PIB30_089622 [Stylosanthes scabra]|uniref:Uncharacterized protein n=1 Tax=Stylosanthes scabra TaxID=79078 RepID=A0ABU6TUL1_9FABA|nr:hypothetical protein [Stylosanthes scabra]
MPLTNASPSSSPFNSTTAVPTLAAILNPIPYLSPSLSSLFTTIAASLSLSPKSANHQPHLSHHHHVLHRLAPSAPLSLSNEPPYLETLAAVHHDHRGPLPLPLSNSTEPPTKH